MVRPGQLACQESVVRLEFLGCRVPLERACPVYQESPALLACLVLVRWDLWGHGDHEVCVACEDHVALRVPGAHLVVTGLLAQL